MKKIMIIIIFLLFPINAYANDKVEVTLKSCIDGDTARFIMNNEEIKVRFLAIDTPEISKKEEPYGKEAKDFTCDKLTNADKIILEFDDQSDKLDKYDRYLAWVFYDDNLLESELIKNGLAEVKYLYGNYKYTSVLQALEEEAKNNKVGMYSDIDSSYYTNNTTEAKDNKETSKNNEKSLKEKILDDIYEFIMEILKEFF